MEIHKSHLSKNGFAVLENIYSEEEVKKILNTIDKVDSSNRRLENLPTCLPFVSF